MNQSSLANYLLGSVLFGMVVVIVMLWLLLRAYRRQRSGLMGTLQTRLAEVLHHPHAESQELDGYLEELEKQGTLSPQRMVKLEEMLRAKRDNLAESISERNRADTLLHVLPLAKQEREDAAAKRK